MPEVGFRKAAFKGSAIDAGEIVEEAGLLPCIQLTQVQSLELHKIPLTLQVGFPKHGVRTSPENNWYAPFKKRVRQ